MSVYSYPESKLIDKVTFVKTDAGPQLAYVHAKDDDADHSLLNQITAALQEKHWQVVPHSYCGEPVLEVRGFSHQTQLTELLEARKWADGKCNYDKGKDAKVNFTDTVKKRSLFGAGLAYILGDIKFITYGMKGESPLNMAAGFLYGGGTASSLLFGRKDQSDIQIRDISKHMADYLNKQHIELPPDAAISAILDDKKKGKLQKADDFLRRYPAELMNSFFAMAGVCIAIAAYRKMHEPIDPMQVEQFVAKRVDKLKAVFPHAEIPAADIAALRKEGEHVVHKFHKTSQMLDIGLGGMTFTSGMFANLVKEKKRDPDAQTKEGLAGVWDWIQERPLTVAGVGYMISTMCHAASTAVEYNIGTTNAKKAILDRGVFVASNLLAEFLVAISSKGHGEGVVSDKSVDQTAIAIAADVVARQPADEQQPLIAQFSEFLGQQKILAMKDTDVQKALLQQVELMKKNPWAMAHQKAEEAAAKTGAEKPLAKAGDMSWLAKTKTDKATTQPQLTA
ncbi:MAG: hypothetical protein SFT92_00795 [Rickettsiales bacterium]|nr:hypothetical protein [Rickettsiales bacterium]